MHYVFVSQVTAHDVIAHDCKLKRGAGLGTLYKIDTTHFLISLVTVHFGEMYGTWKYLEAAPVGKTLMSTCRTSIDRKGDQHQVVVYWGLSLPFWLAAVEVLGPIGSQQLSSYSAPHPAITFLQIFERSKINVAIWSKTVQSAGSAFVAGDSFAVVLRDFACSSAAFRKVLRHVFCFMNSMYQSVSVAARSFCL